MSEDRGNMIFGNVGNEYGYENVSVEWSPFKAFKVQWQRSYNWISFRVSDYIKDAPSEVLEALAVSMFKRVKGERGSYSDAFRKYVLAPEFSQKHRKTFIERGRYLYADSENKNLSDSVDRLVKAGLIPEDHNIEVVWDHSYENGLASTYSVLMRTIMVSYQLDDKDVPDYTIDYAIYHAYLTIEAESKVFGTDVGVGAFPCIPYPRTCACISHIFPLQRAKTHRSDPPR